MRWIRTAGQIGQAVKNVQRLRQILTVFAKHGFADVVERARLTKFLPGKLKAFARLQSELSTAERLRHAFEDLGPTFVKLGQLLSTRSDILPEIYIEELTKLQDNVLPLPFAVIAQVVERELGQKIETAFASFSPTPLASASIAQVHEAMLHSGELVVVKVQRPEIERTINNDVSLLAFLAGMLEKYVPELRVLRPMVVVDEFFRTLSFEIDFKIEAANIAKMTENMAAFQDIKIPQVYRALSTHQILTLEKLEGIPLNNIPAIDAAGVDRKRIVELGARAFFKSVFIDGLFHGDLHGGNLFILKGNQLGIIDFGIVGRLSERSRDQLASMLMSLLTEDFENLCYTYAELGAVNHSIDLDGFQREVRNTLAPYLGLKLDELNVGKVLIEATRIATKYEIQVPGDWMIVFKAILTMEGMGRQLDPSFDMMALGRDLIGDLVKNQYSIQRMTKDAAFIAKDLLSLLQMMPRQLRWMIRKLSSNDFAFEVRSPQLEEMRIQLDKNSRRSTFAVLSAGLFVASAIALQTVAGQKIGDYPVIAVVFLGAAALLMLRIW